MSNSPTTLIRPWKGFANLRVYPAELRRDLEELDSFIKDIRQAVGKMVGEVSITNTTITTVSASTTIFADYGLDGGGQLTSDVHLSVDAQLEATGSEAWTGSHAWEPSLNSVPVTISKTASLLSADLVRILDVDDTPLFVIDNVGLTGINCEPDAMLTVQGAGALTPPIANPTAWYRADSLALNNNDDVNTWADSSGNGNHLTGAGSTLSNINLPTFRPKYNAAAQSKAITNLPTVSFEGDTAGVGQAGYFNIDTAPLNFTFAAGWTICMIVRDYSAAISNASTFYGANVPAQDSNQSDNIRCITGSNINWLIQTGVGPIASGDANYSTIYAHGNGNDTEAIVLRVGVGGTLLKTWVDGVAQTSTADTRLTNYVLRYIGRHVSSAGSVSGVYGKAVAEIIIYNTALSDANVAIVNTYLLSRVAGTASSTSYDLTRWKNTLGTTVASIDPNGVLNITTAVATQAQIGYNTSNYYTTSVSSSGIVTFDAVGAGQSFVFSDPVNVTGAITSTSTVFGTNLDGTTNTIPKWTNGPLAIFGDSSITDDGTTLDLGPLITTTNIYGTTTISVPADASYAGYLALLWPDRFQLIHAGAATVANGMEITLPSGDADAGFVGGAITLTTGRGNVSGAIDLTTGLGDTLGGNITFTTGEGSMASNAGKYRFTNPIWSFLGLGTPKYGIFNFSGVLADRTYTWPDASGTVALTSGFPTAGNPITPSVKLAVDNGVATTFMRSDAVLAIDQSITPTWTGTHIFNNATTALSLGQGGKIISAVTDGSGVSSILYQPSIALSVLTDRYIHHFKDAAGNTSLVQKGDLSWEFGGVGVPTGYITASPTLGSTINFGINFVPTWGAATGSSSFGFTAVLGGLFAPKDSGSNTAPTLIGGAFANQSIAAGVGALGRDHTSILGGVFQAINTFTGSTAHAHGSIYGWLVKANAIAMNQTATNIYGGYIEGTTGATPAATNVYGLYLEEQTQAAATIKNSIFLANATSGRKLLTMRDQDVWLGSNATGEMSFNGTTFNVLFYDNEIVSYDDDMVTY